MKCIESERIEQLAFYGKLFMKKESKVPLFAVASSFIALLALNHVWLANWYASIIGLSYKSTYLFIVLLLTLFHLSRAWRIWKGKSATTKSIDKMLEK